MYNYRFHKNTFGPVLSFRGNALNGCKYRFLVAKKKATNEDKFSRLKVFIKLKTQFFQLADPLNYISPTINILSPIFNLQLEIIHSYTKLNPSVTIRPKSRSTLRSHEARIHK